MLEMDSLVFNPEEEVMNDELDDVIITVGDESEDEMDRLADEVNDVIDGEDDYDDSDFIDYEVDEVVGVEPDIDPIQPSHPITPPPPPAPPKPPECHPPVCGPAPHETPEFNHGKNLAIPRTYSPHAPIDHGNGHY